MKKFLSIFIIALFMVTPCFAETPELTTINSVEAFRGYINGTNVVMLDLRPEAAYMGWKIDGAVRGGHVSGALDFQLSWIPLMNDEKLDEVLTRKGVIEGKNIVIYGVDNLDDNNGQKFLNAIAKKNVRRIVLFNQPASKWTADNTIALESYARYWLYVYPEWLKTLMEGGKVDNYDGRPVKVFEASWGEEKTSYSNGHIPNTVHINTDEFEEGPIWNRISDERLKEVLEANGVTKYTLVILYSTTQTMAAARIAWIMMYCGVQDVRILNGGFEAWKNAGLPVSTESTPKTPVKDFGANVPVNRELILDLPEAKALLADPNGRLVSIRSWEEQIGETSGYAGWDLKGRISGDVWGHCGNEGSRGVSHFENVDGTMRNGKEITALWTDWGIHPENKIATYCGTGWRAAEISFDFYVLGWPFIWLYDGGWYEWSNDPSNPFLTGDQKPQFK